MGIFRSTNPTTWDEVDQIVIAEQAPPGSISGVPTNVALLAGRFQRGPANEVTEIGSTGELYEIFGDAAFSGNNELKNKKYGRLRLSRAVASDAVKAIKTFDATAVDIIKFTAKYYGVYGNDIKVTIEDGSTSGKKYSIEDTSSGAVLPVESYDNIVITDVDAETFAGSKLVDAEVIATSAEPDNVAATALATGSDGTIADTDYEAALQAAETELAGNILWCDKQSATVKGYLEQHVLNQPDKVAIIGADSDTDDKAAVIAEVASYRSDRIIYSWPYTETLINGATVKQTGCAFYASVLSQLAPHKDPATVEAVAYTGGITKLDKTLNRAAYIQLLDAGISAWEFDPDFGFKIKSGVLTTLTSGQTQVLRRRMADFLTNGIGRFLKTFQNKVNNKGNRDLVKGAITNYDERLINEGILPSQQDVKSGAPRLIDTESLNTDTLIAQGFFKIMYKRRIFSSMRFIVLLAEIGEGVIVTEV